MVLRRPVKSALHAPVAMTNQAIVGAGSASMDRLLQRIEHEGGRGRCADLPANDAASESIDDECDIDEPGPGVDVGEGSATIVR